MPAYYSWMAELENLRKQIDEIDDQIIALLRERIAVSNQIMNSKVAGQVLDGAREQKILERYSENISDLSTPQKLKRLVSAVLATSRFLSGLKFISP